jgi:fructan beta-fructosidase
MMLIRYTYLIIFFAALFASCKTDKPEMQTAISEQAVDIDTLEKYRPAFHFTPADGWMNDPNGLVYFKDKYHLFYQFYPDSTVWGPMHWGHAISKDLIHWERKPIALYPDENGYIFSGSAVIDRNNTAGFGENAMVAVFTYHDPIIEKKGGIDFQTQGIAYSLNEGETWVKYEGNPVIPNPGIRDFRDPKVFWNEEKSIWQMILVAGDHAQIYESGNLKDWTKISEFRTVKDEDLGVWECPDLFQMTTDDGNSKWVLLLSHGNGAPNGGSGTRYFIGEYDGTTFSTTQKDDLWIDYGTDNYAGVTFNNTPGDDRIFIGWMSNWDYAIFTPTDTWRSAMTLPRKLTLIESNGNFRLKSRVVPQLAELAIPAGSPEIAEDGSVQIREDLLNQSRVSFDLSLDPEEKLSIEIANSEGELYPIEIDPKRGIMTTSRVRSGKTGFNPKFVKNEIQKIPLDEAAVSHVEIILDASSIEIFLNQGEYVMTNQVFPRKPYDRLQINKGEKTKIDNLKIETLKSVW